MSETAGAGSRRSRAVTTWAIWELPSRVLVPVLSVEVTTLAVAVALVVRSPLPDAHSVFFAVLLGALGIAHTEISLGVERVRRRVGHGNHVDLSSVWTFAAAVLLPTALTVPVAAIVFGHLWWRAWRPRVPAFRFAFSVSTVVLATVAASGVMAAVAGGTAADVADDSARLVGLVLAVLVYTTVNSSLVAGAIALSSAQPSSRTVFASWDQNLLEIATLCLGGLTAVALTVSPLLAVLVVPPLLVLHRAVLVGQLETAVDTDGKTGLLTAAAWHRRAELELGRAGRRSRPVAVLVLDLDHFKDVNDTHGHLAGDRVLSAVSDALRAELRDRDLVGRFGGEEFVVMLDGAEDRDVRPTAVAERIRRRIEELRVEMPTPDGPLTIVGLSISVGVAMHPVDGDDLRGLLHVADTALYAAKRAGRNRVRTGAQLPVPLPPLIAVPAAAEPPPTTA